MSDNEGMWTFYQFLGELLHRGPGQRAEAFTPYILAFLGSLIAALMLYAYLAAPTL